MLVNLMMKKNKCVVPFFSNLPGISYPGLGVWVILHPGDEMKSMVPLSSFILFKALSANSIKHLLYILE